MTAALATRPHAVTLAGLLGTTTTELESAFAVIDWAEDEIEQAQARHPAEADTLYHCFRLLQPRSDVLTGAEFVFRGHCRELLDRAAAGGDLRPSTAAEVCVACSKASLVAPLTESAAGLYARMWAQAFPGHRDSWATAREHYEALRSPLIDDLEREARRKLTDPARTLKGTECEGRHHGDEVTCRYAAPKVPAPRRLALTAAPVLVGAGNQEGLW